MHLLRDMGKWALNRIYTIGHSHRNETEFLQLLADHRIELVIDVRYSPRSPRYHEFAEPELKKSLHKAEVGYRQFPELRDGRLPTVKSKNTGWKDQKFQGYADYMQTDVFLIGLHELMEDARFYTVTILGEPELPWRCHRSLIADALQARKISVFHIFGDGRAYRHQLTPMAKVRRRKIIYPSPRASW